MTKYTITDNQYVILSKQFNNNSEARVWIRDNLDPLKDWFVESDNFRFYNFRVSSKLC